MSEQQFHDSVVKADKWSKVIALFVAIGVFLLAREVVADVQFVSIIAATAAIGVRLYIPHYASTRVPDADRMPLHDHPVTGNYHHGAAGLALIASSAVAFVTYLVLHAFLTAVGVGVISGALAYVVLSSVLSSG
ncbi:hypothetical protein [Halorubrum sp. DTA46]|uniref:hypothetical protein n=1 Tax=Halorubrum sp. DTA46 TaxID=3402162 RepID=UPI003AAC4AF1